MYPLSYTTIATHFLKKRIDFTKCPQNWGTEVITEGQCHTTLLTRVTNAETRKLLRLEMEKKQDIYIELFCFIDQYKRFKLWATFTHALHFVFLCITFLYIYIYNKLTQWWRGLSKNTSKTCRYCKKCVFKPCLSVQSGYIWKNDLEDRLSVLKFCTKNIDPVS